MTTANELGLVDHPQPQPYPFGPRTLADVLASGVRDHPDRLALIDGERSWTYAELDEAVAAAAARIGPGQVVLWTEPNSAELIVALLATFRAGGIWISTATAVPESVDVEARLASVSASRTARDPFGVALVTFTSGTTGRPKTVAHSEHGLLAPGLASLEVEPPRTGERIGTPLDLRIANIAILGPISAFLRGSTFVVMHRRFAPDLAADIADFGVTRLFAVPTLAYDLVQSDVVDVQQLASLDRVILGGSGSDPHVLARFAERFGVRPTLSYGLSEAPTGVVRESLDDPIGSGRGFPLPHIDIRVVDTEGADVAAGDEGGDLFVSTIDGPVGELLDWHTRLPRRTGANQEAVSGWHAPHGRPRSTPRRRRPVGERPDRTPHHPRREEHRPTELESAARSAPGVADAVVVGVPDPRLGEVVGLAIKFDDDITFQQDTLQQDVDTTSAAGPDRLDLMEIAMGVAEKTESSVDAVMVVSSWPRNAMGKVDRPALVDAFGPHTRL